MNRAVLIGILLAAAIALGLRCPQLDQRPMHTDEAVQATKFGILWEQGSYKYDPNEYHGPTLPYATLAWAKLTGGSDLASIDGTRFRMVPMIFCVGLILLLPLVADGLGRKATILAGLFVAFSPAMVFYSRYFIHEMLLVFFTFLALAAGWRYTRSRKIGWALLAGLAVGLMQATKETFVLTLAAAGGALVVNYLLDFRINCAGSRAGGSVIVRWLWNRNVGGRAAAPFKLNPIHVAVALAAWLAVVVVFFSSFFTNAGGVADAVRTYLPWLHRAGGASPHIHPWSFYLERLAFFHPAAGPVWSEGLILALAMAGFVAAFSRAGAPESNRSFVRFLAMYTLILTGIYCVISYKTPWCLLSFYHGMILMAGVGAVAIAGKLTRRWMKIAFPALLVAGLGHLGFQAWQASTVYSSDQRNPYVYAQTAPNLLKMVDKINALAAVNPAGEPFIVKVMIPDGDYWPLPWYLRNFKQVGWWGEVPSEPYAPVMIASSRLQAGLDEKKTHIMAGYFELRPKIFLELYVELGLWKLYLEKNKPVSEGEE